MHRWSVILTSPSRRRTRWLDQDGHLSSDPSRALRLASPEVAAQRVQTYLSLHGHNPELIERFRLVPAPSRRPVAHTQLWAA